MNEYDKLYQRLQKKYSLEEIAEAYMIPQTLAPEEQKKAEEEFIKIRMEKRKNKTEKQILLSAIMQLRISIENYLKQDIYLEKFSFGHLIKQYIDILQKNKEDFAKDLDIKTNQLYQIIKDREEPTIGLMYRLEKHTDNLIPALYWWRILSKKIEHNIDTNETKKLEESQKVRNYLVF